VLARYAPLRLGIAGFLALWTGQLWRNDDIHALIIQLTVYRSCLSQDHLRLQLTELPSDVPSELKRGLLEAYNKLAEYFKLLDRSPYYLWASSMCLTVSLLDLC
jgi:hypothetical protein